MRRKYSGWPPRYRKNREFGYQFFKTGKHREFRCNTGKIWTTQGIFQNCLKIKYFIVNYPFINLCKAIFLAFTSMEMLLDIILKPDIGKVKAFSTAGPLKLEPQWETRQILRCT